VIQGGEARSQLSHRFLTIRSNRSPPSTNSITIYKLFTSQNMSLSCIIFSCCKDLYVVCEYSVFCTINVTPYHICLVNKILYSLTGRRKHPFPGSVRWIG
jgi:hypothetical protein